MARRTATYRLRLTCPGGTVHLAPRSHIPRPVIVQARQLLTGAS